MAVATVTPAEEGSSLPGQGGVQLAFGWVSSRQSSGSSNPLIPALMEMPRVGQTSAIPATVNWANLQFTAPIAINHITAQSYRDTGSDVMHVSKRLVLPPLVGPSWWAELSLGN